ncbi:hypothetical protein LR48_Vigan11g097500 [Vigna angularis]|uniref:Uncharacterized protein n=1 Tax=Phaseolus angularis TaxID=3914 RepID=A0A0L9VSX9_PHAAN|nr:hypothetical protein LR48_Vigan11g097500 [Vigna angularis]
MGNRLCEPLGKLGFLSQWKLGLAGQHVNWALQASMGNGISGPMWNLGLAGQHENWTLQASMGNGICELLWKWGFLGQWKLGLAGQHGNWALQAKRPGLWTSPVAMTGIVDTVAESLAINRLPFSVGRRFILLSLSLLFSLSLSIFLSLFPERPSRASEFCEAPPSLPSKASESSNKLLPVCLPLPETGWVIMKAPKLLDLFPIPIIIDGETEIHPPPPVTFRARAPSTELSLRPPQPAREFFFY